MKLSIILTTLNRNSQLGLCISSILKNTYRDYEILIVDQNVHPVGILQKNQKIKYVHTGKIEKSKALNIGIQRSFGEILIFTDDDCIVSENWLKEIISSFTEHPEVACVTGNIFPYHDYPKWACPPTISKKYQIFSKPIYHAHIGFGNNFAIRKSTILSVGSFKEWLGPGSIGLACEDGEMMARLLTKGYKICHDPKIIVFHNKKLSKAELSKQNLSYLCGEMACYGYYALAGYSFARKVVINNFTQSVFEIKKIAGDILKRKIIKPDGWIYPYSVLCMKMRGFVIGLWYYVTETLFK